jgi:phage terminase large subunit
LSAAINADFPVGFEFLFKPARYKVYHSGRGAAKSWSFARALVLQAVERKIRVLCAREWQLSITESVHRLLCDQIGLLGLQRYFTIQQQSIFSRTGGEFAFVGIATNPSKVKSSEGYTHCWVEEAQKVSDRSWEILIPTIREDNSEIWLSMNPDEETDPSYQRFIVNQPPDSIIREVNWSQNPWFPDSLRREKDYLARVDPDAYQHVWQGSCRTNQSSQIFRGKYVIQEFTPPEYPDVAGWEGAYFGADWGFAQDPTVLVKCWLSDEGRKLYIEDEIYQVGLELDDTGPAFRRVSGVEQRVIRADSSRPETINHVRNKAGLRVEPAEKWKGSVEDGIMWLRSREQIVIHPRCRHAQEEARLYSYKVDRLTGDVLPEPVDKHNHVWDAVRYGLEPMIMASTNLGVWSRL